MSDATQIKLSTNVISGPRSVEQIVEAAKEYEYNAQVPVRYWLRTAAALLKEADIYMREGDEETTYLLLFRHAHLVLAHLEAHPDARDKTIKPLLSQARREIDRNLKTLDLLKPKIKQRYDRYASVVKERQERRASQTSRSLDSSGRGELAEITSKRRVQHLHGHQDSDLAVQLAQREFQRRAVGGAVPSDRRVADDKEELSLRMQALRSHVDPGTRQQGVGVRDDSMHDSRSTGYSYPSVKGQQSRLISQYASATPAYPAPELRRAPALAPSLPPKPSTASPVAVPPRPEKVKDSSNHDTVLAKDPDGTTYTFAPTAFLENGNPLRTVFLPPTLRNTFLRLAYQNTKKNLETCGFLAGTLISNALFVSKLIIPAQVATSDTCEMTNESQLFDYVDSGTDLMILGWIHTHPTQTCFMSSRDLHTHAGYQMMLPESVAIVCAPSKGDTTHGGDWGVYRLTDPPGKMAILNCTKPGIFHPHDVENIYTDAVRPGHVVEAKGLDFEVVDLRDG